MISFQVNDMTCGHCTSTIGKAVKAVDPDARLNFDLATHRVHIEPAEANAARLSEAIAGAGYTPVAISAPAAG
jgi:copper chaperone